MFKRIALGGLCLIAVGTAVYAADAGSLKKRAVTGVQARAKLAQQINDQVFSFSELGYQEVETSRYLTQLLEQNGLFRLPGLRAGRKGRAGR
jgi:aminobenzoyl-glutamate utilization protein B